MFLAACVVQAASESGAPLRKQLAAAEDANDTPAIIELSRRIAQATPNDARAWETLARTLLESQQFDRCDEVLRAWQQAMKSPPPSIEYFRGALDFERKDFAPAEQHLQRFVASNAPRAALAPAFDKLAQIATAQTRWPDAEKYRGRAVAARDSAARRVRHAEMLLLLHRWDAALAEIAAANRTDPTDETLKSELPKFERLEKIVPELKALDARIAGNPDPALLLDRARLFALAERPQLAFEDANRAFTARPNWMRARIQTAEALQDLAKQDEAGKLDVSYDLRRDADHHVPEKLLRALGEQDLAIDAAPNSAEPLVARAKTLYDLRQSTLAIADARAALSHEQSSAPAHLVLAQSLDALGNSREAVEHAIKATELAPQDAVGWFIRGAIEAKRADFAAAIESQTRSLKLSESVDALREREKWARRTGKIEIADADLRRIRELEPQNE